MGLVDQALADAREQLAAVELKSVLQGRGLLPENLGDQGLEAIQIHFLLLKR